MIWGTVWKEAKAQNETQVWNEAQYMVRHRYEMRYRYRMRHRYVMELSLSDDNVVISKAPKGWFSARRHCLVMHNVLVYVFTYFTIDNLFASKLSEVSDSWKLRVWCLCGCQWLAQQKQNSTEWNNKDISRWCWRHIPHLRTFFKVLWSLCILVLYSSFPPSIPKYKFPATRHRNRIPFAYKK